MHILIAEDDNISRRILETILTKWNYTFISACDGNQAWEYLQSENSPRLAILDWMMPGMNGVEICRNIQNQKLPNPPYLILLTARDEKSDIVEGLEAGANDYITKPFNPEELLARINVGRRVLELQAIMTGQIEELTGAISHIKRLQGILPICMYCKKIRNDRESWERLEQYIVEHSEAVFSHGVCPECYEKQKKIIDEKAKQERSNES